MYPYNRNTHYFQRQSLTAREAKDPAIAELAEDDRSMSSPISRTPPAEHGHWNAVTNSWKSSINMKSP